MSKVRSGLRRRAHLGGDGAQMATAVPREGLPVSEAFVRFAPDRSSGPGVAFGASFPEQRVPPGLEVPPELEAPGVGAPEVGAPASEVSPGDGASTREALGGLGAPGLEASPGDGASAREAPLVARGWPQVAPGKGAQGASRREAASAQSQRYFPQRTFFRTSVYPLPILMGVKEQTKNFLLRARSQARLVFAT